MAAIIISLQINAKLKKKWFITVVQINNRLCLYMYHVMRTTVTWKDNTYSYTIVLNHDMKYFIPAKWIFWAYIWKTPKHIYDEWRIKVVIDIFQDEYILIFHNYSSKFIQDTLLEKLQIDNISMLCKWFPLWCGLL